VKGQEEIEERTQREKKSEGKKLYYGLNKRGKRIGDWWVSVGEC
jgi:hypothetical protein